MREVKEKRLLKERAAETLKSAPRTAFRRGTDASFQQLRQELREAAQDGQPEDRYESGKITDTADHAVQEVRHLAEKAAHRLPKTKSEPQREARTKSVPQHEQPRHTPGATAILRHRGNTHPKPVTGKSLCARIGFSNQGEAGSSCKCATTKNARTYTDAEAPVLPPSINSEDITKNAAFPANYPTPTGKKTYRAAFERLRTIYKWKACCERQNRQNNGRLDNLLQS